MLHNLVLCFVLQAFSCRLFKRSESARKIATSLAVIFDATLNSMYPGTESHLRKTTRSGIFDATHSTRSRGSSPWFHNFLFKHSTRLYFLSIFEYKNSGIVKFNFVKFRICDSPEIVPMSLLLYISMRKLAFHVQPILTSYPNTSSTWCCHSFSFACLFLGSVGTLDRLQFSRDLVLSGLQPS